MGFFYENGIGVKRNIEEATKWYRKAAEQGESTAQCNLGFFYENGIGVKSNIEEATKWYRKAANNGSAKGYYCLAEMIFKDMSTSDFGGSALLVAASILVPVTNFVTIPAAIGGSALKRRNAIKKLLSTDKGKEMIQYYRKASELGYEDAEKRLKKLEKYL